MALVVAPALITLSLALAGSLLISFVLVILGYLLLTLSDVLGCTSWTVLGTLVTERMLDLIVLISIGEVVFQLLPTTVVPGGLARVMQG